MTDNTADDQQSENDKARKIQIPGWLWGLLLFIGLVFVAPVLGCGAFGAGFALLANTDSGVGTVPITSGPTVAVIRVEGPIFGGESTPSAFSTVSGAGSETISRLLEQANEDDNVKAIVLRVDSPGGGVVASDEIYHAITKVDKPIVVSMGTVAASGGYYISAPTDYIIATPNTITGSIGVISQFITAEEFLDETGVELTTITTGELKGFGNLGESLTEEDVAYWEDLINESYDIFVGIVAEGRGYSLDEAYELADGRVWTGTQAIEIGLVDELGYFEDAVEKAAELGGIDGEPNVVEFTPAPSLLDSLYGIEFTGDSMSLEALRDLNTATLEYRYLGPQ